MEHAPGYPLPSGDLGEDEIVCQLVYLPDRPEYWQAFLAALHYMTTWRAWERDIDKRGKDAAANWREAFELTIGCWRMTCLEQLQSDVAAILAIMEMPQSCCDETDVTDGDQYTDRVQDGEGDVPQNIIDAGYAEDVDDWDGFDDYKCMISHVTVDQLEVRLRELAPLVNTYGAVFGGLASLAAIVSVIFSGGGTALVFGLFAATGAVALLYEVLIEGDLLVVLADKVATNHDDLACSIYQSDGDVLALSNLNDEIDELFTSAEALILKNMNLGPTLKSLYAGRYDQQDIADILLDAGYELGDFHCDCDMPGEFLVYEDWESGQGLWQDHYIQGIIATVGVGGSAAMSLIMEDEGDVYLNTHNLVVMGGGSSSDGDVIKLHAVRFSYYMTPETYGKCRLICIHDGGTSTTNFPYAASYVEVEKIFSPPLEFTKPMPVVVRIEGYDYVWEYVRIDNISIWFDVIPA